MGGRYTYVIWTHFGVMRRVLGGGVWSMRLGYLSRGKGPRDGIGVCTTPATPLSLVVGDFINTRLTHHVGGNEPLASVAFTEIEAVFVAFAVDL